MFRKILAGAILLCPLLISFPSYSQGQGDDKTLSATTTANTPVQVSSYSLSKPCVIIKADINNTVPVRIGVQADVSGGIGFQMNANDQTQKCTNQGNMNFLWVTSTATGQIIYVSGN